LTDDMKSDLLTGISGQIVVMAFQCQCATDTAPRLVCFAATLNCLAVTRK